MLNILNENFLVKLIKYLMVTKAVKKEIITIKLNFNTYISKLKKIWNIEYEHAKNKTGIPERREKWLHKFLSILRNLIAVIIVPDLLMPCISAKTWKNPIKNTLFNETLPFFFWCLK